MSYEIKERGIPDGITVQIDGQDVHLLIHTETGAPHTVSIEVQDVTNQGEVCEQALKEIRRRYWFASESWKQEKLLERFGVRLDDHVVEIYAFGRELTEQERRQILTTLEGFYGRLRQKNLWNLASVQILPRHNVNTKNDEAFRGMEFPLQQRLELYTAGLGMTPYRGGELPCTELEGTLTHEMTHVVLEQALAEAWAAKDLGWVAATDVRIELPGGSRTLFYNTRPQECVTSYAELQQDDDRAESVVAYLYAPHLLESKRKQILNEVFDNKGPVTKGNVTELPAVLPVLPKEIHVMLSEKKPSGFRILSTSNVEEKPTMSLREFRKVRGIPEPSRS